MEAFLRQGKESRCFASRSIENVAEAFESSAKCYEITEDIFLEITGCNSDILQADRVQRACTLDELADNINPRGEIFNHPRHPGGKDFLKLRNTCLHLRKLVQPRYKVRYGNNSGRQGVGSNAKPLGEDFALFHPVAER